MKVTKISAVTLLISDMKKSVEFYSKIPNFNLVYGCPDSQFTSFLIDDTAKSYLNLKLKKTHSTDFGRIIFYVDDVDKILLICRMMKQFQYWANWNPNHKTQLGANDFFMC